MTAPANLLLFGIRGTLVIVALAVGCITTAEGKSSSKARLVNWGHGASQNSIRFWMFNGDAKKGQTFALFDRNGLVSTVNVIAIEQPYSDKPCFRIIHGRAIRAPKDPRAIVAYGPLDELPTNARTVAVPTADIAVGNRRLVGLDIDGDGQADLAFAGPDCPDAEDGYHWCIDSYVHTAQGWNAVEHYFDAEGCRKK